MNNEATVDDWSCLHEGFGTPDLLLEVGDTFGLNVEPRDYTLEGIDWLLMKKRAMLTDEPGLGKTPQAAMAATSPVLVVAPSYLVEQWCDWISAHIFNRNGSRQTVTNARQGLREERSRLILETATQWTVINKEMLRTHTAELLSRKWNTVIFDESHHLRNHKAELSKAAVKIANDAERVYLLTATPIWKEPDDLFMQLRIMHPKVFTSYYRFVDDWCEHESTRFGTQVLGARLDKLGELQKLLSIMRLGRTYAQAGRGLPDVVVKTFEIDFPSKMRKQYNSIRDSYRAEVEEGMLRFTHYSQVMHGLRQLTSFFGKVETVCDIVDDNKSEGALVFTWYKDAADDITIALRRRGHDVASVHGDYPLEERIRRVNSHKHIVATISSLSEGIDLSRMDTVIFAEQHWAPGSHIQALRRVRRDRQTKEGNERPITVAYVNVKNTIDDVIYTISQRRTATLREVIDEALL